MTAPAASIPSPSSSGIGIGPFEVHAYGLMYVLAVAAAIFITRRRWAAVGGSPDLVDAGRWRLVRGQPATLGIARRARSGTDPGAPRTGSQLLHRRL